ncbi:unnamed protein product [Leptidea sinapis]|uniref:PHD-type domain-containing protein n=1 Tax=Leptidea sinapis TaxID=189913 RepID=A0A5E4QRT4_9NEOP|nr:unnamed protein product [Leptidea sinapis]
MVNCGRCDEYVSDGPKCSACQKTFHFQCSGITETGYRKLGERKQTWRCPDCKSNMCSSPSSPSLEKIMERLDGLALQLVPLTTLLSEVQSIKGDISDIKKTVHDNTEKVNRLECRIMTVEKSISDMKKSHSEIKDLKEKVLQLETDLNSKEQWLRTNNVEIKGVPQKPNENLYDLLGKIGTKILYRQCPKKKLTL